MILHRYINLIKSIRNIIVLENAVIHQIPFIDLFIYLLWFNAIFKHNIGYTWQPVLLVEEESGQTPERTTDTREATGKLSHITTFAES